MKPQFKPEEIYLDLSKLSEEQQRKVIALLPEPEACNQYEIIKLHFILWLDEDNKWWVYGTEIKNKTELTYSQFLDMMGEGKEKSKVINWFRNQRDGDFSERYTIVFDWYKAQEKTFDKKRVKIFVKN